VRRVGAAGTGALMEFEIEAAEETELEVEAKLETEFDADCPKICPAKERVKSTAKRNLPVIPIFIFRVLCETFRLSSSVKK